MTESHHTGLGALLATGSQPRRYRWAAIPLRILMWPVVRAWFFHGVSESERLKAEIVRMRQEFEAVRLATVAAHHQLATLQASLASFMVDRSFFEGSIRTELMAMANVVDCYRDTVETALTDRHTLADSRPATLDILALNGTTTSPRL